LKVGDVTVLPDETKQAYYVVKVKDRVEPEFTRFTQQYAMQLMLDSNPMFRNPMFLQRFPHLWQQQIQQHQQVIGRVMEEANLRQSVDVSVEGQDAEQPVPAESETPEF